MATQDKKHAADTAARAAKLVDSGPTVLAVFRADVRATKGPGSTVAVVQGGSGKCRLYGKNSLANALPDIADVCLSLVNASAMAEYFGVPVVVGKTACDKFMTDRKLVFEGKEAVIADVGKGNKRRGGFKQIDYSSF